MGSLYLFIHHPEQVAIELTPATHQQQEPSSPSLGLICTSQTPFEKGSALSVNFPEAPCQESLITGTVLDCLPQQHCYQLAIEFSSADNTMRLRMLEQHAYIGLYQKYIAQYQGRSLSPEAAAMEWIERYAAWFPDSNR